MRSRWTRFFTVLGSGTVTNSRAARPSGDQEHLGVLRFVGVFGVLAVAGDLTPEARQGVRLGSVEGDVADLRGHPGSFPLRAAPPASGVDQRVAGGAETVGSMSAPPFLASDAAGSMPRVRKERARPGPEAHAHLMWS